MESAGDVWSKRVEDVVEDAAYSYYEPNSRYVREWMDLGEREFTVHIL